jgi:hypothetical protein
VLKFLAGRIALSKRTVLIFPKYTDPNQKSIVRDNG